MSRDVDEIELVARAVDGDKAALEEVICLLQGRSTGWRCGW